jgi:four helix bundle protein
MDYETWETTVSRVLKDDALWNVKAYRLALYASDMGWPDITRLAHDPRTSRLSGQLCRALGSVGANIAEGYSRSSHKEKAHYYEYALGSARESRHWYWEGRQVIGEQVVEDRLSTLTEIIRLLLAMIPDQRGYIVREESADYLPEEHLESE